MVSVSFSVLQKQNSETSEAIIDYFDRIAVGVHKKHFEVLAHHEGVLTAERDKEDDEKLMEGINFAKSKGVIDSHFIPEHYQTLDVLGKTPDQVVDMILNSVCAKSPNKTLPDHGVIAVVGLSGTGKGTSVTKLHERLSKNYHKNVTTWSNGNIFRAVTLLAATWCDQQEEIASGQFDAEKALTKANLERFMKMLHFGKYPNKKDHGKLHYDTRIHGLGLDMLVSEVQNTALKAPHVSKNIPTVAQYTQGEVINFAARAIYQMSQEHATWVLLEGREQTVNYVRTPYRFSLVLSDTSLVGKRRAAQRIMAAAFASVIANATADTPSNEEVAQCIQDQAEEMIIEFNLQHHDEIVGARK